MTEDWRLSTTGKKAPLHSWHIIGYGRIKTWFSNCGLFVREEPRTPLFEHPKCRRCLRSLNAWAQVSSAFPDSLTADANDYGNPPAPEEKEP